VKLFCLDILLKQFLLLFLL